MDVKMIKISLIISSLFVFGCKLNPTINTLYSETDKVIYAVRKTTFVPVAHADNWLDNNIFGPNQPSIPNDWFRESVKFDD